MSISIQNHTSYFTHYLLRKSDLELSASMDSFGIAAFQRSWPMTFMSYLKTVFCVNYWWLKLGDMWRSWNCSRWCNLRPLRSCNGGVRAIGEVPTNMCGPSQDQDSHFRHLCQKAWGTRGFFEYVKNLFQEEPYLRDKSDRTFSGPFVTPEELNMDDANCFASNYRFSCTTKMHQYLKHGPAALLWVIFPKAQLEAYLRMLDSVMNLDEAIKLKLRITMSGRWLQFPGNDLSRQCGHKDVPDRHGESPGFSITVTWKKLGSPYVCPGSQAYLF